MIFINLQTLTFQMPIDVFCQLEISVLKQFLAMLTFKTLMGLCKDRFHSATLESTEGKTGELAVAI